MKADSALRTPHSALHRRGMALVITLILLAVITFMAVTFLVLSRNEKGSVTTDKDQTTAENAAETGQIQAQTRLLSLILGYTNAYNFDLMVSTNYTSPLGFVSGNTSPTNVNYEFTRGSGTPLSAQDLLQNIANLLYDPRPPVFISVYNPGRGSNVMDFRYYVDLNRNGKFEPSGFLVVTNQGPLVGPSNVAVKSSLAGDPQWIGMLSRPVYPPGTAPTALAGGFPYGYPHSSTNKFVSRYAYMVVPSGKALDINYIHNYAKRLTPTMAAGTGDGFLRDQGLGSFEINLASFLADLNTNYWPSTDISQYRYNWQLNVADQPNNGVAFDDALSLVRYRYAGNYNSLSNVTTLFGASNALKFASDYLNGYVRPPVMTGFWPSQVGLPVGRDRDVQSLSAPWSGSDNPAHFFTSQDLFDVNKTSAGFFNRLGFAGTNGYDQRGILTNTYNAYTFYRLLSQLGGDSAPEADQINLNYQNVDAANNIVPDMATNFLAWVPEHFFTNVANKLLTNFFGTNSIYGPLSVYQTNINIAHIPIYPTNYYTPSVHRLLQLAANIYDASKYSAVSNSVVAGITNPPLPTVFRPIFGMRPAVVAGGQPEIFICNYQEITNALEIVSLGGRRNLAPVMLEPGNTNFVTQFLLHQNDTVKPMVFGVPLVIGAKKGLPNFNEFSMQTAIQVTRKLEFTRRRPRDPRPDVTNQMYVVTISNVFGIEAWNSYSNVFPHNLSVIVTNITRMQLTNELGNTEVLPGGTEVVAGFSTNYAIPANAWRGFTLPGAAAISFQIPMVRNFMPLPNATYYSGLKRFGPLSGRFETSQGFYVPHWWLNLNTRLVFALVDTSLPLASRIVDYVNLDSWENTIDITDELMRDDPNVPNNCGTSYAPNGTDAAMWCTNRFVAGGSDAIPTFGILNQIGVGLGNITPQYWGSFVQMSPPGQDRLAAIDFFRFQFGLGPLFNPGTTFAKSNTFYAPFVPVRTLYLTTSWQANDPLVHYTVGDLQNLIRTNNLTFVPPNPLLPNIGRVNERYEPWGFKAYHETSPTMFNLAVKDPLVTRSDDWQFPTNKFPNIGWLGRVHRGTPWQTVYLKSPLIDLPTWLNWTGDGVIVTNMVSTNSQFAGPPGQRTRYAVVDAYFTQPAMDRYILDLFTTAFNGNASRGQMSINQTNLAAWSAILGGAIAVSNSVSSKDFSKNPFLQAQTVPVEIRPAGIYNPFSSNQWPAIVRLVTAINAIRATNIISADTNYWNQHVNDYFQRAYPYLRTRPVFNRLGEILEVPELTVASPFLGEVTNNAVALNQATQQGINDAVYERIPQQILGLLKDDPVPRFTIYSWGQALKPADRSVVTGGPFFGMCTNYQITAEVATRAVVRVEGLPIHPQPLTDPQQFKNVRLVIENYNVLPPD